MPETCNYFIHSHCSLVCCIVMRANVKQASNALFNHPGFVFFCFFFFLFFFIHHLLSSSSFKQNPLCQFFSQYEHHCSLNCAELRRYHPLLLLLALLCRECARKRWISTLCDVTKGAVTSPATISLPHFKTACSYPPLLNRRFCKALQMHLSYFPWRDPSSLACLLLTGSSLFPCVIVYHNHHLAFSYCSRSSIASVPYLIICRWIFYLLALDEKKKQLQSFHPGALDSAYVSSSDLIGQVKALFFLP